MDMIDTHAAVSVEALGHRIASLVLERQSLRAASADHGTLEQNRVELVHLQQQLAHALGRQHDVRAA
jgi:hypothetical protein